MNIFFKSLLNTITLSFIVLCLGSFKIDNQKRINKNADDYLILRKVTATLITGANNGDGLDDDSKLTINIHFDSTYSPAALISFYGRDFPTKRLDKTTFDIPVLKSEVFKKYFNNDRMKCSLNINAVGRDHYSGNLLLTFYFYDDDDFDSDDDDIEYTYDESNYKKKTSVSFDFGIGTFHESNTTTIQILH